MSDEIGEVVGYIVVNPETGDVKYEKASSLPAPAGSVWAELKGSLQGWRKAEMHHAAAILQAAHPDRLRELQAAEDKALKRLRILVDREPWAEILHELTPND